MTQRGATANVRRRELTRLLAAAVVVLFGPSVSAQASAAASTIVPNPASKASTVNDDEKILGALPHGRPLTPAQKLASELPPPKAGGHFPAPLPTSETTMPNSNPRDLRGTWYHDQNLEIRIQQDMFGDPVPFTMAGEEILARRVKATASGRPFINASARCRPPGHGFQLDLNFPFKIVQTPSLVEFIFQEFHGRWNVALDPALLPSGKQYQGRSTATWEGNTLVVQTTDYKDGLWLDASGTPLSAHGKLIHRIRKVDNGDRRPYLEIITTVVDPTNYTNPWSFVRLFAWDPDASMLEEYNCEEQIGDPSTDPYAGMVAEKAN